MDTNALKKFAQEARRQLLEQAAARMEQVLRTDSVEIREKAKALKELQEQIKSSCKKAVIDRVAYTWFNRFCALRYMDVNNYTPIGIISPVEGFTQPEILQEAKQGVIDDFFKVDKQRVFDLLSGQIPSSNSQQEAYRLLLVGACNAYHAQMPFLFPKIQDHTELLMPDDLLSENSILQGVRQALTPESCRDVDVIGWLYQFYISERKDEVIGSKKKIQPEDIPAATQLFTPHWIVRYLVENSLGRLWMLNHPDSGLMKHMDYYIKSQQEESAYLKISSPEEIKVCDPACGSGHMLTYAFDLLYEIYAEQGYDPVQIPSLILKKNLYGIEIDERAGALAAFALAMKARDKDRRFFNRGVRPNLCILENVEFTDRELEDYIDAMGRDLFSEKLKSTLHQFERAKNLGSLINPRAQDVAFTRNQLESKGIFQDLLLYNTNRKVQRVLGQVEFLSSRYHVVVANPPYMGSRNMNGNLINFAKDHYKKSKSDMYTMFMERNLEMVWQGGYVAMITIPNWMFLSSYEKLRYALLSKTTMMSLTHNGRGVWGSDFGSCSFVVRKQSAPNFKGAFKRLFTEQGKVVSNQTLIKRFHNHKHYPIYRASATDFQKIPGAPIAYWISDKFRNIFFSHQKLGSSFPTKQGIATGDNEGFLRFWYEVNISSIEFNVSNQQEAKESNSKWFPYSKGGPARRWYGNLDLIVNWENNGEEIKNNRDSNGRLKSRPQNLGFQFREAATWSLTSFSTLPFTARWRPKGCMFDVNGMSAFGNGKVEPKNLVALLNSPIAHESLKILNPTLAFQSGDIARIPIPKDFAKLQIEKSEECISLTKEDWDSCEISWEFKTLPLLRTAYRHHTLAVTYNSLRGHWQDMILEMQRLEEDNNRIFIKAYDLEDELTSKVPISEITLTCNPHYRYPSTSRSNYTDEELEARLREETMKEFISYAVGCMLGRYSLDKPGLILAVQGQTAREYLEQVSAPSFPLDEDNVIPILDEGWFADDITARFKRFLLITFGEKNYEENLAFLENAIGRDIRLYFLKDFYNDHVKMYQKRPIYWLFSSPNGSFNALIYMHRYRPDTISVILNGYLRRYRDKLSAHKAHHEVIERNPNTSQREKTKALKEIEQVNKVLAELKEYEDEILYPLATQQIEIDLDDGVKVNYNKFGKALKKVSGLSL